jgi:hypothetical protein
VLTFTITPPHPSPRAHRHARVHYPQLPPTKAAQELVE